MQSRFFRLTVGMTLLVSLLAGCGRKAEQTAEADHQQRKILYYKDPMHPWLTSPKPGKAPDCGMDMVPVYEGDDAGQTAGTAIKIDPTVVQNIGVKTAVVQKRRLAKIIRTVGKVEVDESRLYAVSTKIMGWIDKLYVNTTGQAVQKGQPLLELYSPDLLATQEEYLLALRYRKAVRGSEVQETVTGSASLIESARRRLQLWDISDAQIAELEQTGQPRRTLTFNAPADGVVLEKMVVQGAAVMPGMELFRIADLARIWVLADVYEYELPWVKLGATAAIALPYIPGKSYTGKVTFIYPTLAMETRTAKVRLEIANPRGEIQLRPEMFATVRITSELGEETIAVPEQAIIRTGERLIAIVAREGGYFDVREVKGGAAAEGYLQILDGLHEGEQLVTSSQFLIDSESNLRAAVAQFVGSHSGHATPQSSRGEKSDSVHAQPQMQGKGAGAEHQSHDADKSQPTAAKRYTCEMHPEVIVDKPGDCPKCGMRLVEIK